MHLEYKNWDNKTQTKNIGDFLCDALLYEESQYDDGFCKKERLEEMPFSICRAMGRLIEKLLSKGIFNLEDLKYIAGVNYCRKSDTLNLKQDDKEK